MFFWLISLLVLVTILALVVHAVRVRWLSSASRFLFYIPGAIAGASSVLLWLFVLDPTVSPVSGLLHAMGFEKLVNVVAVENLPVVFTVIAFWAGAGGWIVIMFGALNNVPDEVMEAARIDGAGAVKTAWYIQLPMLTKWISYMAIMSLAAGVAALRGAEGALAGDEGRRSRGLLAEPARLPLRLPAGRLLGLRRHLAHASRRGAGSVDRVHLPRKAVRK